MDTVILLIGADLDTVLDNLAAGCGELRIAVDDGGVKFKLDSGMWSPPLGELDPACAAATKGIQG